MFMQKICKFQRVIFQVVKLKSRCTYDDDERFEESKSLLRDGVPKAREYASTKSRHFDVENGEDGAENAADDADQQRRSKHDDVHWDGASQLHTQHTLSVSVFESHGNAVPVLFYTRPTQHSIPQGSVMSTSFGWEGKGRYGSDDFKDTSSNAVFSPSFISFHHLYSAPEAVFTATASL